MFIHIPKPCTEKWSDMTPADRGRFCSVCAKTVVDFTTMDDAAVRNYLLNNAGRETCGRFYKKQLQYPLADLVITVDQHWFRHQSAARQLFYAITLFFVLGISACEFSGPTREPAFPQKVENKTTAFQLGEPVLDTTNSSKPVTNIKTDKPTKHHAPITMGNVACTDSIESPQINNQHIIMGGIPVPVPIDTPIHVPVDVDKQAHR